MNIKQLIADSGKSLVEISNESGVSRKTIYNIINDIQVKPKTYERLLVYLKEYKIINRNNVKLNQSHYNDLISLQKEKISMLEQKVEDLQTKLKSLQK